MINNESKLNKIKNIFLIFFKIGMFTFGGGYAMISLIQKEIVEKRKLVSEEDILNIIAIAETTPGPISVNVATFVGFKIAGKVGALFATLGVILPSFITIILIATLFENIKENSIIQNAFFGIRAGVLALITNTLFKLYKKCPKNTISYIIMILSFVMIVFLNINAIYAIICCAIVGLMSFYFKEREEKG